MFIAAIDQGTTSTRCIIFDHSGTIVQSHQKEHRQIYPQPGWVEHDALEILENTREVIAEALRVSGIKSDRIVALGITNQRETTVLWDKKNGKPVHPAIVWQDTRTKPICQQLMDADMQETIRLKTGLPIATYFSATKIMWILQQSPDLRLKAEAGDLLFGTIDSWLIWNLTGGVNGGIHITDVTNASRTMCMNLSTLAWDDELLNHYQIPSTIMPVIRSSSEEYGVVKEGPLAGMPITADLGDQQAALFGQACFVPGDVKNTYGTGCFMLMNTGSKIVHSRHGLLTTVAYKIAGYEPNYALEGSIAISGALVQWLRDNLNLIETSAEVEQLANSVTDSGGIYFVPAFSGLFAPYWRNDARGVLVGLTQFINKGHIARSVLEATAYQTRDVLDAMNNDTGIAINELKVDGGMVVNETLMQFQADILGISVVRSRIAETTALGAAYAAGIATGFWNNIHELKQKWAKSNQWQPRISASRRDALYSGWKKAVTRSFDWID
jgi:glycerol kinase